MGAERASFLLRASGAQAAGELGQEPYAPLSAYPKKATGQRSAKLKPATTPSIAARYLPRLKYLIWVGRGRCWVCVGALLLQRLMAIADGRGPLMDRRRGG